MPRTPSIIAMVARCTSENAPKVTTCSTGMPAVVLTCAEIRTTWRRMAAVRATPGRCLMSAIAIAAFSLRSAYAAEAAPARLVNCDLAQQVELAQHLPRAEHDRRQRIFGARHRQAGLFTQALVEIAQQRAA